MDSPRISIGRVEVVALLDGDAPIGTIVEHFPAVDADAILAWRDRAGAVHGEDDTWRLLVRAWLVRHAGGTLLMDTGVGETVTMSWFPEPGRLHAALADEGVGPGDVDTVVLSHVHDDHIGGTTTAGGDPAFPNARYVLQRA